MRFVYAAIWVSIFGTLGWLVHTGDAFDYASRRGQGFANLLMVLTDKFGETTIGFAMLLIGIAFAAWSIWGKEEDEGVAG